MSRAYFFGPASEFSLQEPVVFWDSLGFTADGNEAAFNRHMSVELKHGQLRLLLP